MNIPWTPQNIITDRSKSLRALSELPVKKRALVRALCGGKGFASRMGTLGFVPGSIVTMMQNYGRGPVLVLVKNVRVALGRGEARKVLVEQLPEEQGKND
ncbi:MAG: ferrous iron transport protein A [Anaerolineales bacterium]|nr:ferrous iron transport protein A [Anaerolineales bacterium]